MIFLGYESSCDETSCAVVRYDPQTKKREILANIVASQIETHKLYGGVVPEIASRAHIEAVSHITDEALEKAKVTLSDITAVTVTAFPGLIGALLVGVNFAKSLAYANRLPLVAVNHVKGHVAAAYLAHPDLEPPFDALVISGGHTSLYHVSSPTDFEVFGETRDDAVGEAFDKIARVIGMPYPGGAALDKLAYEGDPKAFTLPSPALAGDTLDFSFSGLKTAALNLLHTAEQKGEEVNRADLSASYTDVIVKALVKKAGMMLDKTHSKTFVIAGGVAANTHIRSAMETMCRKRGVTLCLPPRELCGDNAAMIAMAGAYEYLAGNLADTTLNASAYDPL